MVCFCRKEGGGGEYNCSLALFIRRHRDDFSSYMLTIKRKGVLHINVYFVATLDKDTWKKLQNYWHCAFISVAKTEKKIGGTKIRTYKLTEKNKLCIWITCFYDFVWCGYFFCVSSFHTRIFFTSHFSIEKKNERMKLARKRMFGSGIFFGHNHMNLFGAKQSITQTTYETKKIYAFFLFFHRLNDASGKLSGLWWDEKEKKINVIFVLRCNIYSHIFVNECNHDGICCDLIFALAFWKSKCSKSNWGFRCGRRKHFGMDLLRRGGFSYMRVRNVLYQKIDVALFFCLPFSD